LAARLLGCAGLLVEATMSGDTEAIRKEAADTANFAMMLVEIHEAL
jgi:uncharacterized membrane-anchored protein